MLDPACNMLGQTNGSVQFKVFFSVRLMPKGFM